MFENLINILLTGEIVSFKQLNQGPVVQCIISLTSSLRGQLLSVL